jgi:prepilin peptidase CpaA
MSLLGLVQIGCVTAFAFLLMAAAWQDLRTMRIANSLSLAIIGAFAFWAIAGLMLGRLSASQIGVAFACSAAVFGAGALAFSVGAMGGGDVKLLAAASLFAGPARELDFLTITAVVGGVLGLAILAGAPIGPADPSDQGTLRSRLRSSLPYGPAIAAGGLWVAASLVAT